MVKTEQRRHHGEDWGGHVLPNIFQDRFFSSSKSAEKYLGGGGTMLAHEKEKDHFVSDLLLKILQFYPGLL